MSIESRLVKISNRISNSAEPMMNAFLDFLYYFLSILIGYEIRLIPGVYIMQNTMVGGGRGINEKLTVRVKIKNEKEKRTKIT